MEFTCKKDPQRDEIKMDEQSIHLRKLIGNDIKFLSSLKKQNDFETKIKL